MLWGRVTYELMESHWPAVARGDVEAPPALREWAQKLDAKPKYVVSSTRHDFPWTNSHHIGGDLRTSVQQLKDATPAGVLLGSGTLATELDRLDLSTSTSFSSNPGSPATAPRCTRAGCSARAGSNWCRRRRCAAGRWPCTTGAPADADQPPRAKGVPRPLHVGDSKSEQGEPAAACSRSASTGRTPAAAAVVRGPRRGAQMPARYTVASCVSAAMRSSCGGGVPPLVYSAATLSVPEPFSMVIQ